YQRRAEMIHSRDVLLRSRYLVLNHEDIRAPTQDRNRSDSIRIGLESGDTRFAYGDGCITRSDLCVGQGRLSKIDTDAQALPVGQLIWIAQWYELELVASGEGVRAGP